MKRTHWLIIGFILLIFVFAMMTAGTWTQAQEDVPLSPTPAFSYILTESARVRAAPTQNSLSIGTLLKDTRLTALNRDETGEWVLVNYAGGFGWVRRDLAFWAVDIDALPILTSDNLTPTPAPRTPSPTPRLVTVTPTGSYIIARVNVYVRSGPGLSFSPLGILTPGTVVEPVSIDETNTWIMIRFSRIERPEGSVLTREVEGFGWVARNVVLWTEDILALPVLSRDALTPTSTFTPTFTPSATFTATITPTNSATYTPTLTATATVTATATATTTFTATVSPTATFTDIPTETPSPTATATNTPSSTPSDTPSPTTTPSEAPSPTLDMPTLTLTPTERLTETPTPTLNLTEEPTAVAPLIVDEATIVPSATYTPEPSPTATETATATPSPQPTATELASETPVPSETPTAEPTVTESATVTPSPQPTNTQTPTSEPTEALPIVSQVPTDTPTQEPSPMPTDAPIAPDVSTSSETLITESIPTEAIIAGGFLTLIIGYVIFYLRGQASVDRYAKGFPIDTCPICGTGKLEVDLRVMRFLGIPRPRRTMRCDNCRSLLRETGFRRWRYAVDKLANLALYDRYNGLEIDERALQKLAEETAKGE